MSYYSELIDEMDAAVFSGKMLETHLLDFNMHVDRWKRALLNHSKLPRPEEDFNND